MRLNSVFACVCTAWAALVVVLINVTAINQVGPYFVPSVPVGVATEHEAPYSRVIVNLTAVTRDANPLYDAGPFRYRQTTYTDVFDVSRISGAVRARVSLDRRHAQQYNVSVDVENSASPPHISSLVFMVSDAYSMHAARVVMNQHSRRTSILVRLNCLQVNFLNNSTGFLLNGVYGLNLPP